MTSVKTQINCPNCQQLIAADIQQVFDVGVDPSLKQRFISGQFNIAQCPHCGFNGNLSTPLVYHDPEKDLLMTFIPPEINLPKMEREKVIGDMIKQVVDNLPAEQRKGYLFSPQEAFTLQGLVERILEGEGITKEMLDSQQKKIDLIQKLAAITEDEALASFAKEEDEAIDNEFFTLLSRLVESSLAQGDQNSARMLSELQQKLLPITTFGKEMQVRSQELELAIKKLEDLGENITREQLLELVIESPNENRTEAYVSLARNGMDYQFFQSLSEKIDAADGEEKKRLDALRTRMLEFTQQIDEEVQARIEASKKNLELLLSSENIKETTMQNIQAIDQFFIQVLSMEMEAANQAQDEDRLAKLQQVIDTLNEATQAAADAEQNSNFFEQLLGAPDEDRLKLLEENPDQVTEQLIQAVTSIYSQIETVEDKEMAEKIKGIYNDVLGISMKKNLAG